MYHHGQILRRLAVASALSVCVLVAATPAHGATFASLMRRLGVRNLGKGGAKKVTGVRRRARLGKTGAILSGLSGVVDPGPRTADLSATLFHAGVNVCRATIRVSAHGIVVRCAVVMGGVQGTLRGTSGLGLRRLRLLGGVSFSVLDRRIEGAAVELAAAGWSASFQLGGTTVKQRRIPTRRLASSLARAARRELLRPFRSAARKRLKESTKEASAHERSGRRAIQGAESAFRASLKSATESFTAATRTVRAARRALSSATGEAKQAKAALDRLRCRRCDKRRERLRAAVARTTAVLDRTRRQYSDAIAQRITARQALEALRKQVQTARDTQRLIERRAREVAQLAWMGARGELQALALLERHGRDAFRRCAAGKVRRLGRRTYAKRCQRLWRYLPRMIRGEAPREGP